MLEAKLKALVERFKNLVSFDQILVLPAPPGTKASSSTLDYYMLGASGKVVNSAVMTRAQSMSQATPTITTEPIKTLWARDNSPADQFG